VIRIATRSSQLALAQAKGVASLLGGAELVEVGPDGGAEDKARFVRGVESALLAGEADVGVHSAKDVPAEMAEGLAIASVAGREDPADVWVGEAPSLAAVPDGARVGTASLRRRAQLLAARPDLRVEELHGNVDTRLRRLGEGALDGIVLAAAGLRRLGREEEASFAIPTASMTPAAGQGSLLLQVRDGDDAASEAASGIGEETALLELTAERAVVALLEATCASPIGVWARREGDALAVEAFVGLPDGSEWIRDRIEGGSAEPALAGAELAERLIGAGARELLDRAEQAQA
jgi:hydroxymethylbilane synthase